MDKLAEYNKNRGLAPSIKSISITSKNVTVGDQSYDISHFQSPNLSSQFTYSKNQPSDFVPFLLVVLSGYLTRDIFGVLGSALLQGVFLIMVFVGIYVLRPATVSFLGIPILAVKNNDEYESEKQKIIQAIEQAINDLDKKV